MPRGGAYASPPPAAPEPVSERPAPEPPRAPEPCEPPAPEPVREPPREALGCGVAPSSKPGARVRVVGLKKAARHNGTLGRILDQANAPEGRVVVKLDGRGETIAARPENLELVDAVDAPAPAARRPHPGPPATGAPATAPTAPTVALSAPAVPAEEELECPVCLETAAPIRPYKCAHGLCAKCATQTRKCPLCRAAFAPEPAAAAFELPDLSGTEIIEPGGRRDGAETVPFFLHSVERACSAQYPRRSRGVAATRLEAGPTRRSVPAQVAAERGDGRGDVLGGGRTRDLLRLAAAVGEGTADLGRRRRERRMPTKRPRQRGLDPTAQPRRGPRRRLPAEDRLVSRVGRGGFGYRREDDAWTGRAPARRRNPRNIHVPAAASPRFIKGIAPQA